MIESPATDFRPNETKAVKNLMLTKDASTPNIIETKKSRNLVKNELSSESNFDKKNI